MGQPRSVSLIVLSFLVAPSLVNASGAPEHSAAPPAAHSVAASAPAAEALGEIPAERGSREPPHEVPKSGPPCAHLGDFDGAVQVLPSERSVLVETKTKMGIECGGWITVKSGWAEIKHRRGYTVRLGENSFVRVFDGSAAQKVSTGDEDWVVFNGLSYVRVPEAQEEVRILTANSRIRVGKGAFMVGYEPKLEQTQFIVFEKTGTIENRFLPERKIRVRPGEMSELNFGMDRLVPTEPLGIHVASLKVRAKSLMVPEREMSFMVQIITDRSERNLASVRTLGVEGDQDLAPAGVKSPVQPAPGSPAHTEPGHPVAEPHAPVLLGEAPSDTKTQGGRGLASVGSETESKSKPERYPASEGGAQELEHHLENRLLGGESDSRELLAPKKKSKKPQSREPQSLSEGMNPLDPAEIKKRKLNREDQAERKRLKDAFSNLKIEE